MRWILTSGMKKAADMHEESRRHDVDPDGHGRVELTKFRRPTADSAEPNNAPPNTLGIRRIMFAVEDIDGVARLRAHGAELVGELVQYENSYRLLVCPWPEGILVASREDRLTDSRTVESEEAHGIADRAPQLPWARGGRVGRQRLQTA